MSSPPSPIDSDAAFLSRLIEPELENLPPEVAGYLPRLPGISSASIFAKATVTACTSWLPRHAREP